MPVRLVYIITALLIASGCGKGRKSVKRINPSSPLPAAEAPTSTPVESPTETTEVTPTPTPTATENSSTGTKPTISSFALADTTTGSTQYTNSTSVSATFTASGAANYCVKGSNSTPSKDDACWYASSTLNVTVGSGTTTLYGFAKSADGVVSDASMASIAHSSFTHFAGAAAVTRAGNKHIKVTWAPVSTPFNYDRYNIYIATTSGGQNFNTPTKTISGAAQTFAAFNGLTDGTEYFVVVRASNGTFEEPNKVERSVVTPTYPTIPNTLSSQTALFESIAAYFGGFTKDTIGIGEIVTIVGKYDSAPYYTQDLSLSLARNGTDMGVGPVAIARDSSGNTYFHTGKNKVFKVDTKFNVTTFAGTGTAGYSGDGGQATAAKIDGAGAGLAVDSAGNVYIANTASHTVRKVTPAGIISTVAGNGTSGFSGDGGAGSSAQLNQPQGLAVDSSGNLYISDYNNHRIRKVDTSGNITTIAGTGTASSTGDGAAASSATINGPYGLSFDSSGNLYIAEYAGHRVRKITSGGTISSVAGTGVSGGTGDGAAATSAKLAAPTHAVADASGNIYIAEYSGNRIRKVTTAGNIETIAGNGLSTNWISRGDGGAASSATLYNPIALAIDSNSNVYIADKNGYRIRKITAATGIIDVFIGTDAKGDSGDGGSALSARFNDIGKFVFDSSGNIYLPDIYNNRIRKVSTDGSVTTVAGNGTEGFSGDGGLATSAMLANPYAVARDSAGNLYIPDYNTSYIRKVAPNGTISTIAGDGTFSFSGDGGPATNAKISYPYYIITDTQGNIYFTDSGNNRVRKISTSGVISTVVGTGAASSTGDGGAATSATLNYPSGLCMDSSGNLYVAEFSGHRLRKVNTNGIISTYAGTGVSGYSGDNGPASSAKINTPLDCAVDQSGNVYLGDMSGYLRKIKPDGTIVSVAGHATNYFSGDGGQAINAGIGTWIPSLAVDSKGNVYFGDGQRIRMIKYFE